MCKRIDQNVSCYINLSTTYCSSNSLLLKWASRFIQIYNYSAHDTSFVNRKSYCTDCWESVLCTLLIDGIVRGQTLTLERL